MQSKYEVIGIVGEGAYGVVYKCKNKETGEFVALKKFKEIEDDLVKKTMMRELKVLQLLKHDNIVEYKEAFKRKGDLFLVFEYVDKNLLELLQEHPRGLDPLVIKKLIYQLCKAIKYLHDMNIVHRDIKPENLLVDSNLKLKLCDFGFARTIKKNNDKLTDYVATRWYRSPELLITSGYYGPEVDYWAIGCIMGELADGDPLFPGDNELDQLAVIQKVLGKLPDHQQELFYNNQNFKGRKLPDVSKPETLERRYLGKLSKQGISFMKSLLNPDPKNRLKGDAVFNHPFFENFPDPFPSTALIQQSHNQKNFVINNNNSNNVAGNNNVGVNINNNIGTNISSTTINNFNTTNNIPTTLNNNHSNNSNFPQNLYLIPNKENNNHKVNSTLTNLNINPNNNSNNHNTSINPINENTINISKPHTHNLQQEKKSKIVQPIITNTTNINIINYNNYDANKNHLNTSNHNTYNQVPIVIQKRSHKNKENDKLYSTEKSKNVSDKSINKKTKTNNLPGNMVLTSYNFNQPNPKENILKLYSSSTFHNNFKTFYKGDPYNFDIDMNFIKEKDSEQVKNTYTKNNLDVIDEEKAKTKRHTVLNENIMNTNSNNDKSPQKNKKKSILPPKNNTNNMFGLTEDFYKVLSNRSNNPKVVTKSNTINKNGNVSGIFQLPSINNKNFSLKKLLK